MSRAASTDRLNRPATARAARHAEETWASGFEFVAHPWLRRRSCPRGELTRCRRLGAMS